MKCPSIACLWPPSPPSHRVTATVAVGSPPALYTGASDGSIVWWLLSNSNSEIRPIALLCGHAAPIVSLIPCVSYAEPSLVSASSDGVLCVWSRTTGRCHRRRRLPPWVGTPVAMSRLPSSSGNLCVSGVSHDSIAVVVVDSHGLNVVQTVFHGNLVISRPVKSVVVEDGGKDLTVILVDGRGRSQLLPVSKDSDFGAGSSSTMPRSSSLSSSDLANYSSGEGSSEDVEAVAVEAHGELLAVIFRARCEFRSVKNGVLIGEISSKEPCWIGGMFLETDGSGMQGLSGDNVRSFAIWSANGAAMIYSIYSSGFSDSPLKFEIVCEISALSHCSSETAIVLFCELDHSLIRLESLCMAVGDSFLWKPHVKMWSVSEFESQRDGSLGNNLSRSIGEGGFPGDLIWSFSSLNLNEDEKQGKEVLWQPTASGSNSYDPANGQQGHNNRNVQKERFVSSSMVLSEDFCAPYAVVYGFYNGEIEVVRFLNLVLETDSDVGSPRYLIDQSMSEQIFTGHTGAVLCLAAHQMAASSDNQSLNHVLISGSLDCTVRVWNLDNGCLLWILHHHIAPIKEIILPPPQTARPWNDCFLSVGEDGCVALVSIQTLRVERMFPGHPSCPSMVVWDSRRGYIACLCRNTSESSDAASILYLWDLKTGAQDRVIRGTASRSMFDHFCRSASENTGIRNIFGGTTSASSLLPLFEDASFPQSHARKTEKGATLGRSPDHAELDYSLAQRIKGKSATHDTNLELAGNTPVRHGRSNQFYQSRKHPIRSSCPFPGIACLKFDLSSLMLPRDPKNNDNQVKSNVSDHEKKEPILVHGSPGDNSDVQGIETHFSKESLEICLLKLSLCFLHLWGIDHELDNLLLDEMNISKPEGFYISSGMLGDREALTLMFPGLQATLELWKSSAEFCAMRSLTIVSIAQRMISLSHSTSAANSALAAFYTRNFAEKVPDIKPPFLQLLASFWQDPSEHVRMAARSLFHCAAPRAIPHPLCGEKIVLIDGLMSHIPATEARESSRNDESLSRNCMDSNTSIDDPRTDKVKSSIIAWLESFGVQDWISCIGGTTQDAMASHIIVASALAVWYPSIVKDELAKLVVNQLIKLVMSTHDQYSSTAAELLAEGMESTWKACTGPDITHLVEDIFFQIECLSSTPASGSVQNPTVAFNVREALVGILLPSLAMADVPGFLNVIEGQIWATSSDSPVHLISLKTLIRIIRGSPKALVPYLDKAIKFVLQTMDSGNSVMRKTCLNSSMITLREVARVFPMVALNETSTRLAVGDAIADIHYATIKVYDIESVSQIKVLDASGPLGLPSLLGSSETKMATAITALSFSLDGEGLVAFSENGLMIRWWSLGTAWWEKLSRNVVPVQCTKLIFVPPEGLSPNSSRSSIMASIAGHDKRVNSQEKTREMDDADTLRLLLHNLDLSYRLQWIDGRKVILTRHGHDLGSFQL
ncbi:uncharacterized protein LOC120280128 [Dioscorea cayenensis subsp. rotundata]|uniref:Uncharacterized protein LOC120280128 n=1 Tax=Dioscorea cayennensis subsp. rotundata TaxID=55577 RepID=A0AB40CTP4_DIOCR|nr:uncharacterized protein LOC120280128 [Dioscorea cayenensis subsp. rotundata]